MAQDVDLSPRARTALLWGTFVVLIPALGVLGWVALQFTKTPDACPLCEAVDSGDVARVRAGIDAGGAVTIAAWHDALEGLQGAGPTLEIVALLLDHGADPNEFWTPSRSYTVGGTTASARFGDTTLASGDVTRPSRRRVFAAQVVAERSGDLALINRFLDHGLDVHGPGAGEALMAAARGGHLEMVRRLLGAGVPVNYVASQPPRRTALAEAIQMRDLPLIGVLEGKGAREW